MSAADAAFPPPGCFTDTAVATMRITGLRRSVAPSAQAVPARHLARSGHQHREGARRGHGRTGTRPRPGRPGISRGRRRCRGRASPAAGLDFLPDLSGTCTRHLLRITGVLGGSGAALQPGLPARRRGAHDACWSAPGLRTASSAVRCILRKATLAMTYISERDDCYGLWPCGAAALLPWPSCRRCSDRSSSEAPQSPGVESRRCGGSATSPAFNGAPLLARKQRSYGRPGRCSPSRRGFSDCALATGACRHQKGVPARPHHCRFRGGRDRPAAGSRPIVS